MFFMSLICTYFLIKVLLDIDHVTPILSAILPLFWRHDIAIFLTFAAKTGEMLLWRFSREIGLTLFKTCSFSTILQWNFLSKLNCGLRFFNSIY